MRRRQRRGRHQRRSIRIGSAHYSIMYSLSPGYAEQTYQISKRIEFLSHQAALPPPPCDLPIEEIEEQAERHERQRCPHVTELSWRTGHVSHGGEDGHDAAETVELCDQIGEVQCADETKVAGLLTEEGCLLVDYYSGRRLAGGSHGWCDMRNRVRDGSMNYHLQSCCPLRLSRRQRCVSTCLRRLPSILSFPKKAQ